MNPDERAVPRADVLKKEIVYDGEGHSRQSIEHMLVELSSPTSTGFAAALDVA